MNDCMLNNYILLEAKDGLFFSQMSWGLRGLCPPARLHLSVFQCNQRSPLGICCRVSVGASRLWPGLRGCAVAWKLALGAHLLLPGVSSDIKRFGPLTSA